MSLKKRIIAIIISVIAVISVTMGGVFCSADEADFGTAEEGIYKIGKSYWIHRNTAYKGGEGLPNGDFQQGYKYWAQNFGKKCTDVTSLKTEGDNTYLHFNGEQCKSDYEGITSLRFTASGVQEGTPVAILYKWRGDTQFQIYLEQWDMSADEQSGSSTRVSSSVYTKVIKEAFSEEEWNVGVTSAADGTKGVFAPKNGSSEYFFMIGIQITTDVSAVFDIDDVQLVVRQDNGIIKNLKGEQLYDLNNLEVKAIEETDYDLSGFDLESEKVKMPGPSGMAVGATLKNETSNKEDSVQNKKNVSVFDTLTDTSSPLFWVVVAVGVIIIAGAVVAIILLIKKRNNAQPSEETEEENTETEALENTEEDIQ